MAQRDYLLRMVEEMTRALAQIIYHKEIKDYQAAHDLIEEQCKQARGMGSGFIRSLPDETLLSMLTTLGELDEEKCWLLALLLKAEGDLFAEEHDENRSFYSYLKACNLFLETLHTRHASKNFEKVDEIEELVKHLAGYELPLRTCQLLFWYFDSTGQYAQAETMLFESMDTIAAGNVAYEERASMLEKGEAFYARLSAEQAEALESDHFSSTRISAGLARLRTY